MVPFFYENETFFFHYSYEKRRGETGVKLSFYKISIFSRLLFCKKSIKISYDVFTVDGFIQSNLYALY